MTTPLAAKLDFVLKALSMSRGRLAAELGVDKSAAGRWVSGTATPSAHNMTQLTALVAQRVAGFTSLDWERDLEGLAEVIGVTPPAARATAAAHPLLAIPLLEEAQATARLRGKAYEGFYRSTRPYAQQPGSFIHDCAMIRFDENGALRLSMNAAGVRIEGQGLLLQNQLFIVAAEMTSGAFVFATMNGVSTVQAGVLDGLLLFCALDPGRTPTASAAIFERVGDLDGDRAADDARFEAYAAKLSGVATADSAPEAIRTHLVRDLGPQALAAGGDWLLQAPLVRSLSRGLTPRAR
ncbi:MAG: helix-turn-helix transcriptional regulator [Proteobacteria bacterium]|nr:helix-turn-helix transcriptional regulator [Pseudomonadota bacterium]